MYYVLRMLLHNTPTYNAEYSKHEFSVPKEAVQSVTGLPRYSLVRLD